MSEMLAALEESRKLKQIRRRALRLFFNATLRYRLGLDPPKGGDHEMVQLLEVWWVLQSRRLLRKAETFGIDVPHKPEWFSNMMPDPINPTTTRPLGEECLSERGRAAVNRQIMTARLEFWRSVSQVLIPILSLIVAIIAILKK